MPKAFKLSIMTPDKLFFEEEVTEISVTTPEGSMGVMAGHMPMIAVVIEGILSVKVGDEWRKAAISQGFLDVADGTAELYVDTAEWAEDIDILRSETALRRAEERLRGQISRTEYLRTQAAVARAMARLKAAGQK